MVKKVDQVVGFWFNRASIPELKHTKAFFAIARRAFPFLRLRLLFFAYNEQVKYHGTAWTVRAYCNITRRDALETRPRPFKYYHSTLCTRKALNTASCSYSTFSRRDPLEINYASCDTCTKLGAPYHLVFCASIRYRNECLPVDREWDETTNV